MGDYINPKTGFKPTYTAGGTITGGDVVVFSAANTVVQSSGGSSAVAGIATKDAVSGEKLAISRDPIQRPIAGGTIAFGDHVMAAASGRVVKWTSGTDAPERDLGTATEAATVGNPVTIHWKG